MTRRKFLQVFCLTTVFGGMSGCTREASGSGSSSRTTLPDKTVTFPDGPKEPPERPDSLTNDTVQDYVREYERRYVYNQLWEDESSLVGVACKVKSVEDIEDGFKVTVSCEGEAKSGGSGEDATPVYSDYFESTSIYYIDATSLIRKSPNKTTQS